MARAEAVTEKVGSFGRLSYRFSMRRFGKVVEPLAVTRTPSLVSDDLFDALREHFGEARLVELTAATALRNYRARFHHAFGMPALNQPTFEGLRTPASDCICCVVSFLWFLGYWHGLLHGCCTRATLGALSLSSLSVVA